MSQGAQKVDNPLGIRGVNVVEVSGDVEFFHQVLVQMGFTQIAKNESGHLALYRQGEMDFVLNTTPGSYAQRFFEAHGPCVSGFGFVVEDAHRALSLAVQRGAKAYEEGQALPFPAVYGIGGALVFLVDQKGLRAFYNEQFGLGEDQPHPEGAGFIKIDHFTNNVPRGEMQKWCDFYARVFGFYENRYFHIKGKQTGLESKVMRSPCGTFSIPINEPTEAKSQIQEYLDEYKGSGVQHIAMLTPHILKTMDQLTRSEVPFMPSPPDTYYREVSKRLPNWKGDPEPLRQKGILIDGDEHGYLLQIFTKNMFGPIFFEVIQRVGHDGFGEGNFQALFDAIEQDQRERGYLK